MNSFIIYGSSRICLISYWIDSFNFIGYSAQMSKFFQNHFPGIRKLTIPKSYNDLFQSCCQ